MIDRSKKLQALFYELPSGRKPVRDWLMELDADDRRTVGYDIQTVEFGWPMGMPLCRSLGGGLWEVRSDLMDGKIARVIFSLSGGQMVLLHAFIKKTQKTPQQDIALAAKRNKDIEP
ncbi:MAG: type II toxin-antitoxin system RelE/ParE family toxin [Alphaproteobacteria bacterium]|nr:type II toxin-antitoxin system RelE/ParE family toxin [Alphaproteobacteria bacterium]